jgi:NADH:ubiquinone oxidoreductase subunit E
MKGEEAREAFLAGAAQMYEELRVWRAAHPQASFDEIAAQVTVRRQALMGELLAALACQAGRGEWLEERACPRCAKTLHYKGEKVRAVLHPEGESQLARGYHHCDHCGHGFFPPG